MVSVPQLLKVFVYCLFWNGLLHEKVKSHHSTTALGKKTHAFVFFKSQSADDNTFMHLGIILQHKYSAGVWQRKQFTVWAVAFKGELWFVYLNSNTKGDQDGF